MISFEQWKQEVNIQLMRLIGMAADDLPDYNYWEAWDVGDSPEDCAEDVIEYAKTF